jgi:membrane-associated protein
MNRRHFFTWSAVGAALWVTSITLAGYFLGGIPVIRDNLEAAILLIVFLSVLPMVYEYLKHRREAKAIAAAAAETVTDAVEDVRDGSA